MGKYTNRVSLPEGKDGLYRALLHYEAKAIADDSFDLFENFNSFFGTPSRQELLYELIQSVDHGKFMKSKIVTPIIEEVTDKLSDPTRAAMLVAELNIPLSSYPTLAKAPYIEDTDGKIKRATVAGVELPSFHASTRVLNKKWSNLKTKFNIQPSSDPNLNSYQWDVLEAIQFMYNEPSYSQHIADKTNLKFIVRGDGIKVGNRKSIFLIGTLGNVGILGKTIAFNVPLNIAEVNEKNQEDVRKAFYKNLQQLGKLSEQKVIDLFPDETDPTKKIFVNFEVDYGGDESWLRMLLGLLSAAELHACLRCLWQKGDEYNADTRVERVYEVMKELYELHGLDQKHAPLLVNVSAEQIHKCLLHCVIALGKDLCEFNHQWMILLNSEEIYNAAATWLHKHHIHGINLRTKPSKGSWNIKGCHTWEWLLNWSSWCETVQLNNPEATFLVTDLVFYLEVLYKWCFWTVQDFADLTVYSENIHSFITRWKTVIAPHKQGRKERNYYHWLEVEALEDIKTHGSVWKYASDVTESFGHILKETYLRFTSRGGGKQTKNSHWCKQVFERICIRLYLRTLSASDGGFSIQMFTPHERKKIRDILVEKVRF